MAITLADFNKIWASTSPLTPYSFSESNYKQGWNFIGSTPPARQMWDFLQKNNDKKMQYLANNYLPLSGGTMTGNTVIKRNVNNSNVTITGGTRYDNSASVILNGGDASANAGTFQLLAQRNTSDRKFLIGYPDGTLTWGGQNVSVPYQKRGTKPSITVPDGVYILVAYDYGFSVPSPSNVYVGLFGGGDFNDGTQHIGVVDILKGSGYANLGLTYSITTDGTKKITVSLTLPSNANISLIPVYGNT